MTILVLAQKRIIPMNIRVSLETFVSRFSDWNAQGQLTKILLGSLTIFTIAYIGLLYWMFGLSFQLQREVAVIKDLQKTINTIDIKLQTKESTFVEDNTSALQLMQTVSHIKYISPENVAVSFSTQNP